YAHRAVAVPRGRESLLDLGLGRIVELGPHGLGERGERLVVEALADLGAGELADEAAVVEVGAQRVGDAGILDLDDDLGAVVQLRRVHLAERGRRERRWIPLGEQRLRRLAEILLDDTGDRTGRHGGRAVPQATEHLARRRTGAPAAAQARARIVG